MAQVSRHSELPADDPAHAAEAEAEIAKALASGSDTLLLAHLKLARVPDSIRALSTQLRELTLTDWRPLQDVGALASLTKLSKLTLNVLPHLTDLTPLAGLSALRWLSLSNCTSLADLRPLGALKSLEELDLQRCLKLLDLGPLRTLTALQRLILDKCLNLTALGGLAGLSELHTLRLARCWRVADFSALRGLERLTFLDVEGCLSVVDLGFLGRMNALERLCLDACESLSDVSALSALTRLKWLSMRGCHRVTDLSPLRALTALDILDLDGCAGITNLEFAAGMRDLRQLRLNGCQQIDGLQPLFGLTRLQEVTAFQTGCLVDIDTFREARALESLQLKGGPVVVSPEAVLLQESSSLRHLYADDVRIAPRELASLPSSDNCATRMKAWAQDIARGGAAANDTLKLFVLGNGRVGKTQIVRRLRGLAVEADPESTHGVETSRVELLPDAGNGTPLFGQVWDFGGQDIYLSTHSLFLDDRAIYLMVWEPDLENDDVVTDHGLEMRNRRLEDWLGHVRALVGVHAPVLVVQSKCDHESMRREAPISAEHGFHWLQRLACSAHGAEGLDRLWPELRAAARLLRERTGDVLLPRSWVAVGEALRHRQETQRQRVLSRADFDGLCAAQGVMAPSATLQYLHQSGQVFSLPDVFDGNVILDQAWALEGLYALLHRQKVLPVLRASHGLFTAELLDALIWSEAGYGAEDQSHFLSLMKRCGVCFEIGRGQYVAPDCLPDAQSVAGRMRQAWRGQAPAATVTLSYAYLPEGIRRSLISIVGEQVGPDAVYWRYGALYYDEHERSTIQLQWLPSEDARQPQGGRLVASSSDRQGGAFLRVLLERLQRLLPMLGRPGRVEAATALQLPPTDRPAVSGQPAADQDAADDETRSFIHAAQPPGPAGAKPPVYVSYAWGGASEAWVDALELRLTGDCDWRRDKSSMVSGAWISHFMAEIAEAHCVVVVLSDKYLKSPYCMRELLSLYRTSLGDKSRLLQRVVPVILADVRIASPSERLSYARHWQQVYADNAEAARGCDLEALCDAASEQRMIHEFKTFVPDLLTWANDVLVPRPADHGDEASLASVAALVRHRLTSAATKP